MAELSVIPRDGFGFSSKVRAKTAKAAWQRYVKSRWPRATMDEVRAEWGLSEWEARSIVYGQISQATEDKIFQHRKWTLLDAFDFFLYRTATTCNELADKLDEEAEHARVSQNRRSAPRQRVALRLASDPISAEQGQDDGQVVDIEGRSFDRP